MTRRSRPGPVTGLPSAHTVPLSGFSSPAMMFSNVVLPQPLAPTRQTNSPSSTFRLTRSRARTAPDAPLKLFETLSIASFEGAMTSSSSVAEEWWRRARCILRSFEQLRRLCRALQETRIFSILHRFGKQITRYFAGELDPLPRLCDCVWRKISSRFLFQFFDQQLLRLCLILLDPFR